MKEENIKNDPSSAVPGENNTLPENSETGDKKRRKSLGYDAQMAVIRGGLANAGKEGLLKDSIAKFGYDEARITGGLALINACETARTTQLNAMAARAQKYRQRDNLKKEINIQYMDHVKIARVEFKDNIHILGVLGLDGRRKKVKGAWREQVMQLYGNTTEPGVIEGFAKHSVTSEMFDAIKQKITQYDTFSADATKAKSQAEAATEDKNKAYKILLQWWRDFTKVVKVAVRENPQLQEQLSIITPTST